LVQYKGKLTSKGYNCAYIKGRVIVPTNIIATLKKNININKTAIWIYYTAVPAYNQKK
jgi:hypothetical protein